MQEREIFGFYSRPKKGSHEKLRNSHEIFHPLWLQPDLH
jgi:hypothetical protein